MTVSLLQVALRFRWGFLLKQILAFLKTFCELEKKISTNFLQGYNFPSSSRTFVQKKTIEVRLPIRTSRMQSTHYTYGLYANEHPECRVHIRLYANPFSTCTKDFQTLFSDLRDVSTMLKKMKNIRSPFRLVRKHFKNIFSLFHVVKNISRTFSHYSMW